MNAENALKLARRFIELPQEKRRLFLDGLREEGVDFSLLPIPADVAAADRAVLSYAQRRMWFLWQLDPHGAAYNLPMAVRLKGKLNQASLQGAFDALVIRHESLRCRFVQEDGDVYQQVLEPGPVPIGVDDLTALPTADLREQRVEELAAAEARTPFDLTAGPLLRVRLLQLEDQEHVLLLTLHHIIADGWSLNLLIDEFLRLYDAASAGEKTELAALPIHYRDYALWQRSWLEAGEKERQLAYWREKLGDRHEPLELPTDHPRPAALSHRGARHAFQVEEGLAERLRALARQHNVTLFVVLLAAFKLLLQRYSGQTGIRVGVPVANRHRTEVEGLIGCFINTQVLHTDLDPLLDVTGLLARVRETVLGAQAHQDLPFESLVDALQLERSLDRNPLFQVMFNHQPRVADVGELSSRSGLVARPLQRKDCTVQFDLTLDTYEQGGKLCVAFTYALDLFEAASIARLAGHWRNLLEALCIQPERPLAELPLLGAQERQRTLLDWNPPVESRAGGLCLQALIEEQVAKAPEAVAVVFEGQSLTYGELNRRANRLAHALRRRGVGPDVLVGIAVERSLEMLVGLLGILKAGGAYVPLDPEYPQDRLAYMLEDSGIRLLLTQTHLLDRLPLSTSVTSLSLDRAAEWQEADDEGNLPITVGPENLAYVIYTSGSTGKPKGALLPHANVLRLFSATEHWFHFGNQDVWTLFHSYAFDFSVWEIFGALLHGGRLVVVPRDITRSPEDFHQLLLRERVTVLNQTPSAFKQLMPVACAAEQGAPALSLRHVVFGGEALEVRSLRPWLERFGGEAPSLINMYGITETTVHVSHRPIRLDDLEQAVSSPIGAVIPDLSWYVLEDGGSPVVQGGTGELYVGRAGLARGYHNRPALTAERFVPDPFDPVGGGRLYRTGDLARYRAAGVVEYVGRIDHQVKIRGFRIELGEIEAQLLAQDPVREAVVLAQEGPGGKQLVGYVVSSEPLPADAQVTLREQLKTALRARLPDYMVPAHLLFLDDLPLTANGKLDRKALPQPDASQGQQAFVAPESELERQLAAIWQDVLQLERVGLTDNFFELGGDSIVSLQVVSRARQAGIRLSPKDLFQNQTVQGLATVAGRDASIAIDQGPVAGPMPLTPIQHGFFAEAIPQRHYWNQALLLQPVDALDEIALRNALLALQAHHDALRLRFEPADGEWCAEHSAEPDDVLWVARLDDAAELTAWIERTQASLSLERGPLLRALLVTLPDASQRLLLVIHHLVVDGVSWRILLEDLQQVYRAPHTPLPAKTSAFQAWGERLAAHAVERESELAYWQGQLGGSSDRLPVVNPAGGRQRKHARVVSAGLSRETTRRLLQEAPAAYRTQVNDLLLTALARVIAHWTGQDEVLVRLEGHGREALFDDIDLSRTVGWFTSLYPVRLSPRAALGDSIKTIKEQLRAVPDKGIGYGVLRHLGRAPVRQALAALPRGEIVFNYLGQFDGSFSAEHGLWLPAPEGSGAGQSPEAPLDGLLSVEGQVYEGELSLGWTFSREVFDETVVQHLADEYVEELDALVAHCCDHGNRGVTPSDFPLADIVQAQLDALPVPVEQIADLYGLSPMQQGMLFHSLYNQRGGHYINQLRVTVEGLDGVRFRQAWQATLDAHDILRSGFLWQGGQQQPLQVVYRQVALPFVEHDWRGQTTLDQDLDDLATEERRQGFVLEQAPLLRLVLVRVDEQRHQLIYTHHHILMDGWSNSRLLGEVLQRYAGQPVPAPTGRYRDYIRWLQRQDPAASEAFWKEQLAELNEPTRLAHVMAHRVVVAQGHADHHQVFEGEFAGRLKQFAQDHKVTVNTLVQSAWLLLLQHYSGQETVCFGATVAGRPAELAGVEEQIGLFINTLPVIGVPRADLRVVDWVAQVQARNLDLREFEYTPLYEVQRWAGQGGDGLFDSLLVFENYPVSAVLQQAAPAGLHFGVAHSEEQTSFPLMLEVGLGETLTVRYGYDRRHFDGPAVAALARHFGNLLRALVQDGQARLGELAMLDQDEYRQVVRGWNPLPADPLPFRCIHQGFEAQVEKTPEALALVAGERELSYGELNRQANRLAYKLRERGVGQDVLVGIALKRDLDLAVALLAVLKAGGAYVPLDPEYPPERVAYMLKDSQALLLLSQSSLQERLPQVLGTEVLLLDQLDLTAYPDSNPCNLTQPASLAYSIYTSGSTGLPKGVLIEHRNVAALIDWALSVYSVGDLQGVLASTSICFDLSVWELFVTLAAGGYAVLAANALELPHLPARERVRLVNTVPSAIKALSEAGQLPASVRIVNLAGEALKQSLVEDLYRSGQVRQVYDLYGPSEDTTYSTCTLRTPGGRANIGRPISNSAVYLLDTMGQPVPAGVAAELCMAGAGLARGYLNRPALTAEKFLPDPFGEPGSRLYRTGDLARCRDDGVIEYVGRIDHQVKIRGFRIELGEIETKLQEQDAVREAVVLALDAMGGLQLVAYAVPQQPLAESGHDKLRDELKAALKAALPDYMVPAHLLFLDHLPLTPNGKLDRKALPKPDASQSQQVYVAPRTERERHIAAIWAEVLKVERVGLTDHFFELGGHSLLATQVISRVRQALAIELPLRELFEAPTLAAFVQRIDGAAGNGAPAFATADRAQPLVLSYAQQRQWFLWQLAPTSAAYHIPTTLRLKGVLDIPALQRSFDALVQRHESLRTTFQQVGEQAVQVIHPQLPVELVVVPVVERDLSFTIEEEVQRPFDLEHGPLLRVKLLQLVVDEHVLVLTLHHIVTDGWSTPVMVDELVRFYEGFSMGVEVSLPPLEFQYADYALWQRQWMDAGERERQLAYWQAQLGDEQPVLELPTDHPRPAVQSHAGASLDFVLDDELARALKQRAQEQGVTLFMLLLASFQTLLHRYSGQDDIRVGVPIANRNRLETEGLIGFFVNTQVLKATFTPQLGFDDLLQQVKATALGAQAHQDLPFEQLVEVLQPERNLSRSPLFQVMFNHQRVPEAGLQGVSGLTLEALAWPRQATQFDLSLETMEREQGIQASLIYCTALFESNTIKRLGRHWVRLLEAMVRAPHRPVSELPMLGADEFQRIVHERNATAADFPATYCLQALIEAQVTKAPEATALVFGETTLSYDELNLRANRLAHALRERGVGPDVLVGIAVERSLEMVVGLLGILKAGGAYVPLDPEYPSDRLSYMLEDSGIGLLLTQSHLTATLPIPEGIQCLELDSHDGWLDGYSDEDPLSLCTPDNLAYVIYTSGSTGRPKGAGNSHRALVNRLWWMQKAYGLGTSDRVLQKTPFSFDVSVWEFFWPLLSGARLVLAQPGEHREPERLVETINRHGVTTLHFVPSMLQVFMAGEGAASCRSIARMVCSGEALPIELVRQVRQRLPAAGLFNLYGPTEAAIDVTHWTCGQEEGAGVPIGRPIDNLKTHVLEPGLLPAVDGGAGELYLGGVGLARGYHARPGLTAERFVPDPFDTTGGRLYRTGDLARYRGDGVIDYLGRLDHQVKVRGLRIELGEIEARLLEQAEVREAVVLARDGLGGKQLVGYVVPLHGVPEDGARALGDRLKTALRAGLPDYMVPAHLVFLDGLPVTPNGKLDRKALPEPDASQQQAYVAPRTELEQQVAAIWAEVLEVEQAGLSDHFFELGGHSLLATQVVVRVRERIGIEMALRELFEFPVLAAFSEAIESKRLASAPLQDELAKSLEALKRLTAEEIDELIS
ncbi:MULTISPECIES: non-ribosomal peptide synthetase [unclassified Pseudomonas]|uniref:non-ribosomal peptide synthetase n=1 Tax=unclassified Pseudomonas TaxID=196821 RepID=UPI00244A7047|nr:MULTISPECIES: non-ribosomal peptide synthetase [unclassified Pseudomonas]MDH0485647.1 amino acid adenylation domain-containing protein [Pseudomonas sp. GD04015]MDH0607148.1 amino acid adenylation domain-containing protein [Pseudomonas sp. GD03869]